MKQEFIDYLRGLGMTNVLIDRATEVFGFYQTFRPDNIEEIFVSEVINEDGTRQYLSLWLFDMHHAMEAKNFINTDDFDLTTMGSTINYIQVKQENYDFKQATTKSRLNCHVRLNAQTTGNMQASRENCDHLRDIVLKYFVPNLEQ